MEEGRPLIFGKLNGCLTWLSNRTKFENSMLNQLKEAILDTVLPRICLGCGQEGKYVCNRCDLLLSEAPIFFSGGDLTELVSGWEYDGLIKEIIVKVKYAGLFDAIDELAKKILETRKLELPAKTIITFVPMFKRKERERGFNQAELIARKVGELTELEILPLLEKTRNTVSQTNLGKAERFANVKGSIRLKDDWLTQLSNRLNTILLVDDVWTSGATMRECARVLKRAGAKRVFGFTLARTI
jgi:ComF family protein